MTADDFEVLHDLYITRLRGKGGDAVKDEYLEAADRLTRKGWLTSRPYGHDTIYALTDAGFITIELAGLNRDNSVDQN
jgi:hypothetical protein